MPLKRAKKRTASDEVKEIGELREIELSSLLKKVILQVGRGVLISVYFEPYSSRSGTVVLKEGHNPLIRIFRRITDREGKKKSNTS